MNWSQRGLQSLGDYTSAVDFRPKVLELLHSLIGSKACSVFWWFVLLW